MGGELAFWILIILAFVAFIFWARSTAGKTTLKKTLGDPHSFRKRQRMARKQAGTSPKSTKRPTR
jgi:hypothetical protein